MLPWELIGSFIVTEKLRQGFFGVRKILAENNTRVALHISVSTANGHIWLSTNKSPAATGGFFIQQSVQTPFRLAFNNDGPIVCKAWYASSNVATDFTVFESFLIRDPITDEPAAGPQTVDDSTGEPIND